LLLSALLLLSSWAYSQVYDGPALPEGWLPIHETELTQLQTLLEGQTTQLQTLRATLTQVQPELTEASKSLTESRGQIATLQILLSESERGATRLTRQRNLALVGDAILIAITAWLVLR